MTKLDANTVLAIREECSWPSTDWRWLWFDSLEDGKLMKAGAEAAAKMAGHAEGIRQALLFIEAARLLRP